MRRIRRKYLYEDFMGVLCVAESLIEAAAMVAVYRIFVSVFYEEVFNDIIKEYISVGLYAMLVLLVFYMCDGFKFGFQKLTVLLITQTVSICIVDVFAYFQICLVASRMVCFWGILVILAADVGIVLILTYAFTFVYHKSNIARKALLIYAEDRALNLMRKMESRSDSYHITETVNAKVGLENIKNKMLDFDAVILSGLPTEFRNELMKYCYSNEICMYVAPEVSDIILSGAHEITLLDEPLRLSKGRGLTYPQRFLKRACDLIFASTALILFMPLMLFIMVLIRVNDGGPVFYRQKRVTRDGREFNILKFRSMVVDADKDDRVIPTVTGDPRVTRVGRWIRRMRLDELPQLINVIVGDMSLVGPRPERVEHVRLYSAKIPEWHFREKVRAGMTGYAQVFGKYNTDPYDKLRLDLLYIGEYSLLLDLKLLMMTPRVLFSKEAVEAFRSDDLSVFHEEKMRG